MKKNTRKHVCGDPYDMHEQMIRDALRFAIVHVNKCALNRRGRHAFNVALNACNKAHRMLQTHARGCVHNAIKVACEEVAYFNDVSLCDSNDDTRDNVDELCDAFCNVCDALIEMEEMQEDVANVIEELCDEIKRRANA